MNSLKASLESVCIVFSINSNTSDFNSLLSSDKESTKSYLKDSNNLYDLMSFINVYINIYY